MKVVIPMDVNEGCLVTNVANEVVDWTAGSYNEGDRRVYGEYVYEAQVTTTDEPDVGAAKESPTWLRLGRANKWRMWRDGTDSRSSRLESIDATVTLTEAATSVALLGLRGISARVTVTDPVDGEVYDATRSLVDIGVGDWWEYFFLPYSEVSAVYFDDLPSYPDADVAITIEAATPESVAECGRAIIGAALDVGITLTDVSSRTETFSRKERDQFGNLTLVPRRTIRILDYTVMVERSMVDAVQQRFGRIAAVPALFVGSADFPETIVYGVYETFDLIISGHAMSRCSLQVQEY